MVRGIMPVVAFNFDNSKIINLTTGKQFPFEPFAKEMLEIINAGGLMNFVKQRTKSA